MKFAGVICLVYFTICVNAAAKKCSCCKEVLQKLNKLECPKPGTLRHVFYLADVSNVKQRWKGFLKLILQMRTYQFSLKALPIVQFQD